MAVLKSLLTLAVPAMLPMVAGAQLPGLPVLQNAFANPGITVGLNYGREEKLTDLAAAAAWAPGSGRFSLSAGIGSVKPSDTTSSFAYAGRVSFPVLHLMGGAAGVGAFAGAGAWPFAEYSTLLGGLSAGYRKAMGTFGVSVHAAPSYQRYSASGIGGDVSSSLFRFSAGVDLSYGARFGATLGIEGGAKAKSGDPGPPGSIFGLGISYALRRVQ